MVQGISGVSSKSLSIAKVESKSEGPSRAKSAPSPSSSKANFDDLLQLSIENRVASESRLEDLDSALSHAGQVQDSIRGNPRDALDAHGGLNAERVFSLLED